MKLCKSCFPEDSRYIGHCMEAGGAVLQKTYQSFGQLDALCILNTHH